MKNFDKKFQKKSKEQIFLIIFIKKNLKIFIRKSKKNLKNFIFFIVQNFKNEIL